MFIGERIKTCRVSENLTQKELAQKLSLTPKMVSFYENDERIPPADILIKLSKIFDVSTDYLLGISDEKSQSSSAKSVFDGVFAERLCFLLKEDSSLDINFFSNVSRIPINTLKKYADGSLIPSAYDLCKLVEALDTSADYLYGKTDIAHPSLVHTRYSFNFDSFPARMAKEMEGLYLETELAELLDTPISNIKKLLSGESDPDSEILYQMAQIFKKSTDYLLGIAEQSREKDLSGNFPYDFNSANVKRIAELLNNYDDSEISEILDMKEEEVYIFRKYGFIPHSSILIKLAEMFHVSVDYILNRSDSKITVQKTEERLVTVFQKLNDDNQIIALAKLLELEKEQFLVAAKSRQNDENSGKSSPSNGTEGGAMIS